MAYHVLNRANGRLRIFKTREDFEAFERVLEEAKERFGTRVCAYSLASGGLAGGGWRTLAVCRLVDPDAYTALARLSSERGHRPRLPGALQVLSHSGGRPFSSGLPLCGAQCTAGQRGRASRGLHWSSLWRWKFGDAEQRSLLSAWPVARPSHWLVHVNRPQTEAEEKAIRNCMRRGSPYGDASWIDQTAERLGLQSTLRAIGRPKKMP